MGTCVRTNVMRKKITTLRANKNNCMQIYQHTKSFLQAICQIMFASQKWANSCCVITMTRIMPTCTYLFRSGSCLLRRIANTCVKIHTCHTWVHRGVCQSGMLYIYKIYLLGPLTVSAVTNVKVHSSLSTMQLTTF